MDVGVLCLDHQNKQAQREPKYSTVCTGLDNVLSAINYYIFIHIDNKFMILIFGMSYLRL